MSTATATAEPAITLPIKPPALPYVDWPDNLELDDHKAAAVAKLSRAFTSTEAAEETFRSDVAKLVDESLGQPIRECAEGGKQWKRAEKLRQRAADLALKKCELRHELPNLLRQLLPDFSAAIEKSEAIHERQLVADVAEMVGMGLGDSFAEARSNPEAINHRLKMLASQKEWIMGLRGVVNRAKDALVNAEVIVFNFPQASEVAVAWPTFGGLESEVARLLQLGASPPGPTLVERLVASEADHPQRDHRALKLERLLRETELERYALLPAHEDALRSLIDLIDDADSYPLRHTKDSSLGQARELAKRLPLTRVIWGWLQETRHGALTRELII